MSLDYKKAGVDIAKGDQLVDWLKSNPQNPKPHAQRLVSGIGGFSALFRGDFPDMKKPVLVSATDGVGTKLKVALHFKDYSTIGQDLVAMCVNDLVCSGAQPLFFLDYFACGALDLDLTKSFLTGLQQACTDSDCALIGGETAEMPGVYHGQDFDCAGFAVGVVDEEKILQPENVKEGDVLLAIPSSGFHSNGYSLLRKVFSDDMDQWRQQLLEPTRLYVKPLLKLLQNVKVKSVAHITGGGMDNLTRVVPKNLDIKLSPWKVPFPFCEVKTRTETSWEQMLKTLNCGVGLGVFMAKEDLQQAIDLCKDMSLEAFHWGDLVSGKQQWILDWKQFEEANQ